MLPNIKPSEKSLDISTHVVVMVMSILISVFIVKWFVWDGVAPSGAGEVWILDPTTLKADALGVKAESLPKIASRLSESIAKNGGLVFLPDNLYRGASERYVTNDMMLPFVLESDRLNHDSR